MPAKKKEATDNQKPKPQAEEKPQPERVIWRGDKKPPSNVRIGMLEIEGLPDEATQRAGFEHDQARELVSNLQDYKFLKEKGER